MTVPFPQLCFTLAAPYGAWGAASAPSATTAWKATELDPPKSAITGLLGAALGVERTGLAALAAAVRVAVRTGVRPVRDPMPDYHTVSRAHRPPDRTRWSRFEELRPVLSGLVEGGTLLSLREYWSCGVWAVAVAVPGDVSGESLQRLAAALRTPRWPLYAGRKSCTLGLPPAPDIITTETGPVEALMKHTWPWDREGLKTLLAPLKALHDQQGAAGALAWDEDYPGAPDPLADGSGMIQRVWRHDQPDPLILPDGRIHPRFHDRTELRGTFPAPPAAETPSS